VRLSLSVFRSPAGDITVRATYRSAEPRCLSRRIFVSDGFRNGLFTIDGGFLFYGSANSVFEGTANPPHNGNLFPKTPFERSPLVFEAVWPSDAQVFVNKGEKSFESTVGAATGIAYTAHSSGRDATFNEGGKKVDVLCPPFRHAVFLEERF
jgi:hypothetical protein